MGTQDWLGWRENKDEARKNVKKIGARSNVLAGLQ